MNTPTPERPSNGLEPEARPSPLEAAARAPLPYRFRRRYGELFTNKGCGFVLREEHAADLLRLYQEFNRQRPRDAAPLSLSDIVNAALDFVLDHPVSFQGLRDASRARDAIAGAVLGGALSPSRRRQQGAY